MCVQMVKFSSDKTKKPNLSAEEEKIYFVAGVHYQKVLLESNGP